MDEQLVTPAAVIDETVFADRPSAKTMLPFAARRDLRNEVVLDYQNTMPDGTHQPFHLIVGDPFSPDTRYRSPLGVCIFDLMQLFFREEAKVDGLAAERDELLSRVKVLEGDVKRLEAQAAGRARSEKGK